MMIQRVSHSQFGLKGLNVRVLSIAIPVLLHHLLYVSLVGSLFKGTSPSSLLDSFLEFEGKRSHLVCHLDFFSSEQQHPTVFRV